MTSWTSRPVLFAAVLATVSAVAAPVAGQSSSINLDEARDVFAEAKTLSDADGGKLWGRRLYGPILLVDPSTRSVVANRRDKERHLRQVEPELFVGRLPDAVSLGNTTTRWAGLHWTMLLWPLPGESTWRGALLMHECFHRLQPGLGLPLAVPANHHMDTRDGRVWSRLEWRALAEALDDPKPLESDALRDALVFRAYRRSLFPEASDEERELELNEGLAEYTGVRLSGAPPDVQRRRAIESLHRHDQPGAPLVRSFAYASGAAYGLLLDEARPGWSRNVGKKTDYGQLLTRAIKYRLPRPKALAAEAERRAGLYDVESLHAEEGARDDRRQTRLAALRAQFVERAVLTLPLTGSFNYSFGPHQVEALDGVGTVYSVFHLSGPWGILDAPEGALMTESRNGARFVHVPAPDREDAANPGQMTGTINGPGWTLALDRAWRLKGGRRPGDLTVVRK